MFTGIVYFAGPMTLWGRKVAEKEIIFRVEHRWRWLVVWLTLAAYSSLDRERCGYIIRRGDVAIAWARALDEARA